MTTEQLQRTRRVAIVNGLAVFVPPTAFALLAVISFRNSGAVTPTGAPPYSTGTVVFDLVQVAAIAAALALLAAWRTWVHAMKWQSGQGRGWQGVAEAAGCGLLVALLYLAPGIVTRPADAPPYVIFYGVAAIVVGGLVGLVLRLIAVIVLRLSRA